MFGREAAWACENDAEITSRIRVQNRTMSNVNLGIVVGLIKGRSTCSASVCDTQSCVFVETARAENGLKSLLSQRSATNDYQYAINRRCGQLDGGPSQCSADIAGVTVRGTDSQSRRGQHVSVISSKSRSASQHHFQIPRRPLHPALQ